MINLPPVKACFLFLIAFFFISISQAQIAYTNVNPDITVNSNSVYQLDLNSDGIPDFDISYSVEFPGACSDIAQLNYFIRITPKNFNSVATDNIPPVLPVKLDSNSVIDKNLVWRKDANQLLFSMEWFCQTEYWSGLSNGNWVNTTDKFLPLKLRISGNTYYGWIGIDVSGLNTSFGSFKIKDYAFNTIPRQPILAGETSCTPVAVNVTAGSSLTFCTGDSVTLTANTNAYKYQWRANGVNIPDATSSTYVAKTAGIYKVKVVNSCSSLASICKIVYTPCKSINPTLAGMSSSNETEQLFIYPNPAVNIAFIQLPVNDESIIEIFDVFGKKVFSDKSSAAEMLIDLSDFNTGLYLVKWNNGRNNESKILSVIK